MRRGRAAGPYGADLEYLQYELAWVEARARRIGCDIVDVAQLGCRFALAGGHIEIAVIEAAFRAASAHEPLSQARLEQAALEELAARDDGRNGRPIGFDVVAT